MLGACGGISCSGTSGCSGRGCWRRRRSRTGGCWSMAWRSSPPGRRGRVRRWRRGPAISRGSVRCCGSRCAGWPRPRWRLLAEDLNPPEAPRRLDRKPLSPGLFGENICRCTRVPAAGCRAAHQAGTQADRAAERPRVRRGCRNLAGAAMGSALGSEPGARADRCARGRGP